MYSSQFSVPAVSYQHEYESDSLDRQQSDLLQEGLEHEANDWNVNEGNDNFKVVIRVRPPLLRELRGYRPYQCTAAVEEGKQSILLSENLPAVATGAGISPDGLLYATYRFTFDHVYDQTATQDDVYQHSAKQVVLSTLQGYNAAIIAYGQTGTGKTYTMEGEPQGSLRGIIPRTVGDIFNHIAADPDPTAKYLVRASYLQIYNEVISDLLKPERTNLVIREDKRRGVFVDGLSEWVVRTPTEVYGLMQRGAEQRATGATKMNEVSSRSHAVCIIIVEKCTTDVSSGGAGMQAGNGLDSRPGSAQGGRPGSGRESSQSIKVGKLNLVDLAGSERVHITGATGKRLEESKKINASLSALGNVIAALTDRRDRQHIPYRDSKLTRILEDSLGGNCKTTMMCMISPSMDAFQESLSTLKFANRAKNIKNQAVVNEDLDQRTLLRKYERELKKLRSELTRRNRELVDKRALLEIEEQKRRAEADKLAALTELEKRSQEFMREKEAKRALEAKISAMQGQMLVGSSGIADMPAFRAMLQKENSRIRGEYEARLKELEAERTAVEEDLAQVDRYKTLLLKQRDIMIALTARLNERDEQIVTLQEELEAYDKHQRKLEDALDQKTAELIALRKAALEHAAVSPMKNTPLASALGDWGGMATPRGQQQPSRGARDSPFGDPAGGGGLEVTGLLDRPGSAGSMADHIGSLQMQTQALQQELGSREAQLGELELANQRLAAQLSQVLQQQQLMGAGGSPGKAEDVARLQREVERQVKEKAALRTILETKALPLAEDLARSLDSSAAGAGGAGSAPDGKMAKQLVALRHLLTATVKAMSRAEAGA